MFPTKRQIWKFFLKAFKIQNDLNVVQNKRLRDLEQAMDRVFKDWRQNNV